MALKKKGGLAVLHRHYDKVIVVAVLIGLLVSLLYLSQSTRRRKMDSEAFDQSLGSLSIEHPKATTVDPAPYEKAQEFLATPFQMQPATNRAFLVAQERVWCVECRQPIRFDAEVCPLCSAKQPGGGGDEGWDSDGDGIPDALERKYGLNPLDPTDVQRDLDNDGFSNVEEHRAGTDLLDPKSHPPRIAFLRVKDTAAVPFPLLLRGSIRGKEGRLSYQLNDTSNGQTYYVGLGQPIGATGYTLSEATTKKVMRQQAGWSAPREVEIHVVVVTRGTTRVTLEQDAPPAATDYVVTFLCEKDRTPTDYTARPGASFTFDDEAYEVIKIDTARKSVVIRRLSDKEEIAVPQR